MSASSKKKLRKEQDSAKMTEKQLTAQREAKKLNLYTTIFVAVMVVLLVIAVTVGVTQTISAKGIREKGTTALTVGSHKLSNAQLNYFYMDAINEFYSNYGSYASLFGLDVTQPLNEQVVDEASGTTWADDFLNSAKESAASIYAMADAAEAAGFVLSEEELTEIDNQIASLDVYATMYGYSNADAYLKAYYGNGADVEGYSEYMKLRTLASSYYSYYSEALTYEDSDLRAAEAENYNAYTSYSYNTYYVSANKYLTGGTTDADGNTTYTDEETAASIAAAEEAAKTLAAGEYASAADFDAAVAELNGSSSTVYDNTLYTSVNSIYSDWLTDDSRTQGDVAYFENANTTGTESASISGYYVVYFVESNENNFPLVNVRHILVTPEHSHEEGEEHSHDETYTEEELAQAKAVAEEILNQWKTGDATEDAFAALANEKSADGDGTTGGLYENVYPGQMVETFNDWCFDASRKAGDTGIVESTYGYHVMYFVGESGQTYRDYLIENELRTADVESWYNAAVEAMTTTDGNMKYIKMDLVLNAA